MIGHYYHVYADGDWQSIVTDHMKALRASQLWDQLEFMRIGIVGSSKNRAKVRLALPEAEVIAEADEGWEQVTLEALHKWSVDNEARILYAHTKGAWSQSELADVWRQSMTFDNVMRWRELVPQLMTNDVAGAFWIHSDMPEHRHHRRFFAGNYWWANTAYLRTLPPIGTETRYQAEGWIGLGDKPRAYVIRDGVSYWGNFASMPRIP